MNLIRQPSTPMGTFGDWYKDDGTLLCKTVELPWDDNIPDKSCLPAVPTLFERFISPEHGQVWLAQNTAPRVGCEVHNANFWFQLLGCIGVGDSSAPLKYLGTEYPQYTGRIFPAVCNSQKTLIMLRSYLPERFTLNISWATSPVMQ